MKLDLPEPDEILEELADKAAVQIERLAPVAFDAALKELTQYHHFLLCVNASRTTDGNVFNYAEVPGQAWRAPHNEWISSYRRLFERAANHIGDAPDFFEKLAHTPMRLLPRRGDPKFSDEVLRTLLDLDLILVHQLESWVTKRTVTETGKGESASPRLHLAGTDAKSYANLLPRIVGAWESLLQVAPTLYNWREHRETTDSDRWDSLRASWPYLWHHLHHTAYMLAVAVWNEDEIGAALFREALVRWPQTLSHEFRDRAYLHERRLLFPDIASLNLVDAQQKLRSLLPEHMPDPAADEIFSAMAQGAHGDVMLLTAALLLQWTMDAKQASDIGARTSSALLRGEVEGSAQERRPIATAKSFTSLMMDIVRQEMAGDRRPDGTYGAALDRLVEQLDNMTERRVVPGRIFTPSTLHGRDGLQASLLAMLLASAPDTDEVLTKRIQELAKNEEALPSQDRSLRDVLQSLDRFTRSLDAPHEAIKIGTRLIDTKVDFAEASSRLKSILASLVLTIEHVRTERLRTKPIDTEALEKLRSAVELALLAKTGGIFWFRGFTIGKSSRADEVEVFTSRLNLLSKAQFVNPPMEAESSNFKTYYSDLITKQAGSRVWTLFTRQKRETVTLEASIEEPLFWQEIRKLAADVGAEPMLIVSRQAEGRALRRFVYGARENPRQLTIERKTQQETGNSYIATVDGIDVFGADFEQGTAWLFSPYILQSIEYASLGTGGHIANVSFQPDDSLKGPLVTEFWQRAAWNSWLIYEIKCNDPPEGSE